MIYIILIISMPLVRARSSVSSFILISCLIRSLVGSLLRGVTVCVIKKPHLTFAIPRL